MKQVAIITALLLTFSTVQAQRTPESLGQIAFRAFKKDSLEKFFQYAPSYEDLIGLAKKSGLTLDAAALNEYKQMYPAQMKVFYDKCRQLRNDTVSLELKWSDAKIIKTDKEEEIIPTEVKGVTLTTTTVRVYISSGKNKYILKLTDIIQYNSGWKVGDGITLWKMPE